MSSRGAILLAIGMLILGLLIGGMAGGVTGFVMGQNSRFALNQFMQRQPNQGFPPSQQGQLTPPAQQQQPNRRGNNGFPPANQVINGVRVDQIEPNGPAANAGVQVNDIITAVGSTKIDASHSLADLIQAQKPGDKVDLSITRGTQTIMISVVLGASSTDSSKAFLGITYSALPGARPGFPNG